MNIERYRRLKHMDQSQRRITVLAESQRLRASAGDPSKLRANDSEVPMIESQRASLQNSQRSSEAAGTVDVEAYYFRQALLTNEVYRILLIIS